MRWLSLACAAPPDAVPPLMARARMTAKPAADQIAWTVALLLSGVAAGMFLMDCFGYYPVLPRLADHTAIQLHQTSVGLHRSLFRLATVSSGVSCLIVIVFFSERASRGLLIASLASLIALVVYTNYALIPLNQEIGTWTAAAPPSGWKTTFSDMIVREQSRSALPVLAFVLQLAASGERRRSDLRSGTVHSARAGQEAADAH